MAFYRIYPSKDTSIANGDPSVGTKDISDSNVGASEILNLYRTTDGGSIIGSVFSSGIFSTSSLVPFGEWNPFSGAFVSGGQQFSGSVYKHIPGSNDAHILMKFDLSKVPTAALTAGPDFQLKMFDAQHDQTIPTEFNAVIYQSAQDWQEGAGHDLDLYTDQGFASWNSASVSASWSMEGGTTGSDHEMRFGIPFPAPFFSVLTSSAYFYTGHEDLDVNVFSMVEDWISHAHLGVQNFGFFIQIDPALTATDYYIKKFHSRQSHFPTKRPFLEVRWPDATGTLSTSQMWMATSGAWSGSFLDARLSGIMSGIIVTKTNSLVDPTGTVLFSVPSLKPIYDSTEVVRVGVYARPKDWDLATTLSASSEATGTVLTNAYYRVVDAVTDEVLVPFCSGAVPYTKMSYNDEGNYFDLYMTSMPTGTVLRFDFEYDISGSKTFVSGDEFKFRVR